MTVVGIDLGTTNTVVGVVHEGHASAIADEDGERLIPSVVSFHPSGGVLVGRTAKERRLVDASNTIYSIKRLIGRSWDSEEVKQARQRFPFDMREGPGQAALVMARGQSYTLPEISAFVLRQAKAVAEAALGRAVEKAVITVPANFNDLQRAATKVAGRVAGLEVMRILNEPTAAALAYGYGKGTSERIAVYDFGGGTFDVTLLDLSENVFEVLATAGNTFLGGDDIDHLIADRMAQVFLQRTRMDLRSDREAYERLRLGAEELKIRLSRDNEATIHVADVAHGTGGKSLDLDFSMSRLELDQLSAPIVDRTFDVCREAMNIARLSASDFDQVLLVGGSTRIPLVRQRVEEFFKRPVLGHISPDEVVAIGAAIQAAALTGVERRRELPAPPQPASRVERGSQPPPVGRRGTLPPGAQVPPSAEPHTAPYGRQRMPTNPGLQADSEVRNLPTGGPQRVVVAPPGGGGIAVPPGTEPPGTVAGLGARGRVPTGTGLGPDAAAARKRVQTNTMSSAGDAAKEAAGHVAMPETPSALQATGVDDPTHEAGHIASFLARYASTPQKSRSEPGPATPPPPKREPPPLERPKPKRESVAYKLTDDDISYEDPSAMQPSTRMPDTEQLRRMAAPASTDEVTEVHKRRTGSRASIDESRLPIPSVPDELEDMTLDSTTSPGAGQPPLQTYGTTQGLGGPPPPPQRPTGSALLSGSLGLGGPPGTQAMPEMAGPFGQASTLVSPPSAAAQPGPAPGASTPGMPAAPFGGTAAMPGVPEPAPAWGVALGAAAAAPFGMAQPAPAARPPQAGPHAPLLVDVTPLTLAVETVQGYCDTVIARNAPVPCERSRMFVTAADNQTTVRVRVSQGESKHFRENTLLGEVELVGLRTAPRGQVKIEVVFGLDNDGILSVRAVDAATGQEAHVTLRLVAVPEMGQVAEMSARQAQMPLLS
jgi:molecular chaperone DnaK (HSP70)